MMRPKRHPAEVTSDRLLQHYERWNDRFTGYERDAISQIRDALLRITVEDDRKGERR